MFGSFVESYGVRFSGNSLYYDVAGVCEIDRYSLSIDCYCADKSSECSSYSVNYAGSCSNLTRSDYISNLQLSFAIAVVIIIFLAFYIAMSIWYYVTPEPHYQAPAIVEASQGVPTTATVVKQSSIIFLDHENIHTTDSYHEGDNGVVFLADNNYNGHNSFFGSLSSSRNASGNNIMELEAVLVDISREPEESGHE